MGGFFMRKLVIKIIVASILLSFGGSITYAEAATTGAEQLQGGNEKQFLSQSEVEKVDKFVVVKDNQFILNTSMVTPDLRDIIETQISTTNDTIRKNGYTINPETKEINENTHTPQIMARSASVKGLSHKWFWWGERVYFKTNAAVNYIVNRFYSHAETLTGLGIVSTVLSSGVATAVAGSGALYFQHVARRLNAYNNSHRKKHIYMDMNYQGGVSFHTF
ncbi:hypothetical protein IV83_GL001939 [Pediococcus inopinatus]|nr:hypothetical protein IV83_GL001939 [Pediococcus inopinatus]